MNTSPRSLSFTLNFMTSKKFSLKFQKIFPFIFLKFVSRKSTSDSTIFNLPDNSGFSIEPLILKVNEKSSPFLKSKKSWEKPSRISMKALLP